MTTSDVIIAISTTVLIPPKVREALENADTIHNDYRNDVKYWYWCSVKWVRTVNSYVAVIFDFLETMDSVESDEGDELYGFIELMDGHDHVRYGAPEKFGLGVNTEIKKPF